MHVEETSHTNPVILMSRTFDAPRELVWSVLTNPEHVAHWYGGHGFSNPVCEMDVRPGGRWHHVMRTPDGAEHEMNFVFVDVVEPEKLSWRNAETNVLGHRSILTTVTLEAEGKKTKWRMVATFDSVEHRDAVVKIGFSRILSEGTEKLAEILKRQTKH